MGQVIWAIQGQDKPRSYYLIDWFIVAGSRVLDEERFAAQLYGSCGETFPDGIYLNDLSWFREFKRVNSNFSLGLQEIAPEFVRHICELVKASGFPLPPGADAPISAELPLKDEATPSAVPTTSSAPDGQSNPERRPVIIE